jgi:Cu-Zn family superoxide dismutase
MKMTIIVGKDGKLAAASFGQTPLPQFAEGPAETPTYRAGLLAGPGQELHVIDVPDEVMQISTPAEFHARVEKEVRKVRK